MPGAPPAGPEARAGDMTIRFDDRVALVTGAGKGLGRAYALWLAKRGAKVVVNNRVHSGVPSSADAVVEEIRAAGGIAAADSNSVESEEGSHAMIQTAYDAFGRLDILICNAAIALHDAPFASIDLQAFRQVMDINFWGTIYPMHAAFARMQAAQYGRIVLTSSHIGLWGQRGASAYGASKGALIGFARSVGAEGFRQNVIVNIVAPTAFTAMWPVASDHAPLMPADKAAPLIGWLSSSGCDRSGMIFNVGAGGVQRVQIQQGRVVDIPDQEISLSWPELLEFAEGTEPRNSVSSLTDLFARAQTRYAKA